MSNAKIGSISHLRHFKKLRPRLRFADEAIKRSIITAPKDDQSSSEESESIYSDDVAPALSEDSSNSRSKSNAKDFSAIFKVADQVRVVADNRDVESLHFLAEILITCLDNMLRSLKRLPSRIRSAPSFGVAFRGVIFFGRMFAHHIETVKTRLSGIQLTDAVQLSLQSLDMMMASLKSLFDLVERQGKPLPDIPVGSAPHTTSASQVIHEALVESSPVPTTAPPGHASVPPPLVGATEDVSAMPPRTITPTKRSLRRLVSKLGRKTSLRPLTLWSGTISSQSSSNMALTLRIDGGQVSTTPVTPGPSDSDSPDQQAHINIVDSVPSIMEQSAKFLRNVPHVFDLELPSITGELCFSSNGVLCAASLAALIRILTATEAVRDPTFDDFFFCSFRFFSNPLEIFDLLITQYDEGPPEHLEPAHAILWEQNASVAKVRVAKVFLLWLRLHWRHQWDVDILEPLRQFVSSRPANDPASITWDKVTRKLKDASIDVDYRGFRIQRAASMGATHHTPTRLSRPFELLTKELMSQNDFDKVDVLYFHSPTGREEFVRQLCLAASELFRHIDPEDAVRYWKDGQDKTVGNKILRLTSFENAQAYWTSNAIVVRPTVRSRAEVMEFFIDVASQCVELRNFASACAISSGVSLCMTRLCETTEALSANHKATATELENLFALRNRKSYRSTLALEQGPTVPLISTFKHDIEVCNSMKAVREHPKQPGKMLIDLERYRVISRTIQGMELCHARYDFERITYIHSWLQHVLLDWTGRSSEENLCLLDDLSNRVEPKRTSKTSNAVDANIDQQSGTISHP